MTDTVVSSRPAGGSIRVPNIGAEYEIVVYDKDGNEKRRFGGEAQCFVKGFMDYLWHLARNGTRNREVTREPTTFKATTGTNKISLLNDCDGTSGFAGGARANGKAGDVDRGIVVGRSNTPVTLVDYNVGDLVGIDELSYSANVIAPLEFNGNVSTIGISRVVLNGGETAIEGISSIAVYVRGTHGVDFSFMILRDVIPTVDLDSGESMAVGYRMVFNGGVG